MQSPHPVDLMIAQPSASYIEALNSIIDGIRNIYQIANLAIDTQFKLPSIEQTESLKFTMLQMHQSL